MSSYEFITILDLCRHRLKKPDTDVLTGEDFENAQLPLIGGCEVCNATVAAYNSCPSKTGYIRCAEGCIGDLGWRTVEEADVAIFGKEES